MHEVHQAVHADRCSVAVGRDLVLGDGATLNVGCSRRDAQCDAKLRGMESMMARRLTWRALSFAAAFTATMCIGRLMGGIGTACLVEWSIYAGIAGHLALPWLVRKVRAIRHAGR